MRTLRIGSDTEHVALDVPASYDDEGYGRGRVEVVVPGFHATVDLLFNAGGFERLLAELECLHDRLTGQAELRPVDGQLSLVLEGDGHGQIAVKGTAASDSGGNELRFEIALDQSFLARPIHDLRKLLTDGAPR